MEAVDLGEARLVNFRVPNQIKSSFDTVCRINGSTITSELLRMMHTYIRDETPKIEQMVHNTTILDGIISPRKNPHENRREEMVGINRQEMMSIREIHMAITFTTPILRSGRFDDIDIGNSQKQARITESNSKHRYYEGCCEGEVYENIYWRYWERDYEDACWAK